MSHLSEGTAGFRRANRALFAGGLVTFSILYAVQPLIPVFSREFSISPAMGSLSLSVTTAALAVSMLILGSLSDSLGAKADHGRLPSPLFLAGDRYRLESQLFHSSAAPPAAGNRPGGTARGSDGLFGRRNRPLQPGNGDGIIYQRQLHRRPGRTRVGRHLD